MQPSISIIIPTYNELKRKLILELNNFEDYLTFQKFNYELIVVDDGSSDGTYASLKRELGHKNNIKIISYKKNKGKGFAIKQGVVAAEGEKIIFLDADFPVSFKELGQAINYLNDYDVFVGSRLIEGAKIIVPQPWSRKVAGRLFNILAHKLFYLEVNDFMCGFKGFKKEVAKKLFAHQTIYGFCFDLEIILLAQALNYKIIESPVVWGHTSTSNIFIPKESLKALLDLFKLFYRFSISFPIKTAYTNFKR